MSTLTTLRGAAVALLLAVPAARADAQSACASATLADYLTTGFTCRIGQWMLSEFSGHAQTDAEGGAQALASDPANVQVTPFTGVDALGRVTFGFDLSGLGTGAGAHGTTSGFEDAFGWASFGFWLDATSPIYQIAAMSVHGAFDGANGNPGSVRVGSTYSGSAIGYDQSGGIASCQTPTANSSAPGTPPTSVGADCAVPMGGTVVFFSSTGSSLYRFTGEGPIDAYSTGSITRVELTQAATAVPEPSTYALMATGLVGLAGVGRARARRRA